MLEITPLPVSCQRARLFDDYRAAVGVLYGRLIGDADGAPEKNPYHPFQEPTRHMVYATLLKVGAIYMAQHCHLTESDLDSYIRDDLVNQEKWHALQQQELPTAEQLSSANKTDFLRYQQVMLEYRLNQSMLETERHALDFVAPIIAGYDFKGQSDETKQLEFQARFIDTMLHPDSPFTAFPQNTVDDALFTDLALTPDPMDFLALLKKKIVSPPAPRQT